MSDIKRIAKVAFEKYAALYKNAAEDPRYYSGSQSFYGHFKEKNPYHRSLLENAGFTSGTPSTKMRALGVVPRGDIEIIPDFNVKIDPVAIRNSQVNEYLNLHKVDDPKVAAFLRQWLLHQGQKTFNAWNPATGTFNDYRNPVKTTLPYEKELPATGTFKDYRNPMETTPPYEENEEYLPVLVEPFNVDEDVLKKIPDSVRKTLPTQLRLMGNRRPGFNPSAGIPT